MSKNPEIKVTVTFDSIRIYFDNVIHAFVVTSELLGFQSWRSGESKYCIEFVLKGNNLLLEYDSYDKWSFILSQLDNLKTLS